MKRNTLFAGLLLVALAAGIGLYLLKPDPTASQTPVESGARGQDQEPAGPDLLSGIPWSVPIPGKATMVDLGARSCIPCKLMEPVLREVSKEYEGRAAIVFIDVREYPDEVARFGLRAIPTQIFYDADGVERSRHTGFMDKKAVALALGELGVK